MPIRKDRPSVKVRHCPSESSQGFDEPNRRTGCLTDKLVLTHHDIPAHQRRHHPARDFLTVIRSPAAFAGYPVVRDGALRLQINDGEVGIVAFGDPALAGDVVDPLRVSSTRRRRDNRPSFIWFSMLTSRVCTPVMPLGVCG